MSMPMGPKPDRWSYIGIEEEVGHTRIRFGRRRWPRDSWRHERAPPARQRRILELSQPLFVSFHDHEARGSRHFLDSRGPVCPE